MRAHFDHVAGLERCDRLVVHYGGVVGVVGEIDVRELLIGSKVTITLHLKL